MKKNKPPKIIVYDVETSHNILAAFQLLNKHAMIPAENIIQERYMICASWKELGKKQVKAVSVLDDAIRFAADPCDDFHVIKTMRNLLCGADAIIAHYGDKFDIKMLNSRMIFHGFDPLPNIIQIDTYKIAKQKFLFNSNRLDYIGQYLGLGGKIHTSKGLWLRCLNGNKAAIKEMVKYNKQDVQLLEQVYEELAPFAPAKMNLNIFDREACPSCGSHLVKKDGHDYTRLNQYQRYRCKACGHPFRDGKAVKLADGVARR